jgi:hypothetical protein
MGEENRTDRSFLEEHMEMSYMDGIVRVHFIAEDIPLDIAKAGVAKRKEITNHQDCKFLLIMPRLTAVSKEVRDYLSSPDAKEGIFASAMVTKSPVVKIIIRFFMGINNKKHDVPSKIFNSESKAIDWLNNIAI